ncbi:hypothetical protein [Corynebacterium lipophiloflavum]|uniref:Glycerophosphoryl diester phosphodiesterase membrane domain-containing protein n=1 Tax=Corynebacterium lipophiloflavum (strain ATCC 700352 / DSM 44291 / CCUG 37336 / JCM 10383 / DMMZ 1944) TaxID=525263 RepID=C0XRI5_CORLD|nr:hypothetical protein [Corynebacterium lipophiloflavum]EEI17117.1 hypothetical protein HMPREF0298_1055 [Corynebacterium lipophiloflavum DSM 44291]
MSTTPENFPYTQDPQPAPWGVADPVGYAFKRIFSRNWHMWIGLTLIFIVALIAVFAVMVSWVAVPIDGDVNASMSSGQIVALIVFFVVFIGASVYLTALYYNAALRETRGEEQTWGTVFKGVPFGRALLSFVVVLGIMLVVYAITALVLFLASLVSPWLIALAAILVIVALIPVTIVLSFVQVYIIDGYSVGDALSAARRDVLRDFWKVFASLLLLTVIGYALILVTFGIGLLVYVPLLSLASVFIYRKISGGNVAALGS